MSRQMPILWVMLRLRLNGVRLRGASRRERLSSRQAASARPPVHAPRDAPPRRTIPRIEQRACNAAALRSTHRPDWCLHGELPGPRGQAPTLWRAVCRRSDARRVHEYCQTG